MNVTNEMLVRRLRESDMEAFTLLFDRYWKPLYTSLVKRIRKEDDAKDVLQDVFVSLWVRRNQLPQELNIEDYLYAALRNRAINYIQADKVRISYANAMLLQVEPSATEETDSVLISRDLELIIEQALAKMPNRVKEVFLLSYANGYTPREIAEQLSLSLQTVKNYLSDAKLFLRQFLCQYPAELFVWFLLALPGFTIT